MALNPALPIGASILGSILSFLTQAGARQKTEQFFAQPPGSLQPGQTLDLPGLSQGDPGIGEALTDFARTTPRGVLEAQSEERGVQANLAQREANQANLSQTQGQFDPLLQQAQERVDTPAVSQAEVDDIVNQFRAQTELRTRTSIERSREGAGARGLSPDALLAMEQRLSAQGGRDVFGAQVGARLRREELNRAFEQSAFGDLLRTQGLSSAAQLPFHQLGTQLLGDTGGLRRLAATGAASDFARFGLLNEADLGISNRLSAESSRLGDIGLAIQQANQLAEQANQGPSIFDALLSAGTSIATGGVSSAVSGLLDAA